MVRSVSMTGISAREKAAIEMLRERWSRSSTDDQSVSRPEHGDAVRQRADFYVPMPTFGMRLLAVPGHAHVDAAARELVEHLVEPLAAGRLQLGPTDPAKIVVALVVGPRLIGLGQTTRYKLAADLVRHRIDVACQCHGRNVYFPSLFVNLASDRQLTFADICLVICLPKVRC
jgi:hypothetical protein